MPSGAIPGLSDLCEGFMASTQYRTLRSAGAEGAPFFCSAAYTGTSFIPQSGAIPGLSDLYAGCMGSTQYRTLRPALAARTEPLLLIVLKKYPPPNAAAIATSSAMNRMAFI